MNVLTMGQPWVQGQKGGRCATREGRSGGSRAKLKSRCLLLVLALLTGAGRAGHAAPPMVSVPIGMTNAVADEFGEVLPGTDPSADLFGLPVVEGDLVQVLHALDNTIHPPANEGQPHPNNVVLLTSRIGIGQLPSLERPGKFSGPVTPRPAGGSRIFVRVFNAPALEEASFYADSQLFTVSSWSNPVFVPKISKTATPLDPRDEDGDGLHNSWERSYGSAVEAVDTDEDGYTDLEEHIAGSDPVSGGSYLALRAIRPVGSSDLALAWASAPGKKYRVEATLGEAPAPTAYETLAVVAADDMETEFIIDGALSGPMRCYRVSAIATE